MSASVRVISWLLVLQLVVAALAVSASARRGRALLAAHHGAGSFGAGLRIDMAARRARRQKAEYRQRRRLVLCHRRFAWAALDVLSCCRRVRRPEVADWDGCCTASAHSVDV